MDSSEATKRFYDLIWPHRGAVLRTSGLLLSDVHEAEDLAQEVMLKAFAAIGQFQPDTDAKKWLMTILRNARIDRLRARGVRPIGLDRLPMEPADASGDEHDEHDDWEHPQDILDRFADQDMIRALGQLSEEDRWTLLLVDVEGLEQRDAAKILQVPVGTVKSRAHRARKLLRQALLPTAKERRLTHE